MSKSVLDEARELLKDMQESRDALSRYDEMGLDGLLEEEEHPQSAADDADRALSTDEIEQVWIETERLLGRIDGRVDDGWPDTSGIIALMNASHQMTQEAGMAPVRRLLRFLADNGEHSNINEELWSAVDMARAEMRILSKRDPQDQLTQEGLESAVRAIGMRILVHEGATREQIEEMIKAQSAPLPLERECLSELLNVIRKDYGGTGLKAAGRKIAMGLDHIVSNHLIDEDRVAIEGANVIRYTTPDGTGLLLLRALFATCPAIVGGSTIGKIVPLLGTPNLMLDAGRLLPENGSDKKPWPSVDKIMIPALSKMLGDAENFRARSRNIYSNWQSKTGDLPQNVRALGQYAVERGFLASPSAAGVAGKTERWARGALVSLEEAGALEQLVSRERFRIYVPAGLPALIESYGFW